MADRKQSFHFKAAKKGPFRDEVLAIARRALADRRSCGGDANCIGKLQEAATKAFRGFLDNEGQPLQKHPDVTYAFGYAAPPKDPAPTQTPHAKENDYNNPPKDAYMENPENVLVVQCIHQGWGTALNLFISFDKKKVTLIDDHSGGKTEFNITGVDDTIIIAEVDTPLDEPHYEMADGTNYLVDNERLILTINRVISRMSAETRKDGPVLRQENSWLDAETLPYYQAPCNKLQGTLKPQF